MYVNVQMFPWILCGTVHCVLYECFTNHFTVARYYVILGACIQEVFADVKDDEDDEFEIVPVKSSKTADDLSDGLFCILTFSTSIIIV